MNSNFYNFFFNQVGGSANPTQVSQIVEEKLNQTILNEQGQIDITKIPQSYIINNLDLISSRVRNLQFDAIIAEDGSGDYTNIEDAWNAGCRRLLFRPGEYQLNEYLFYLYNENTTPLIWVAEQPKTVNITINRGVIFFAPFEKIHYGNFQLSYNEIEQTFYLEGENVGLLFNIENKIELVTNPYLTDGYIFLRFKYNSIVNNNKVKLEIPSDTPLLPLNHINGMFPIIKPISVIAICQSFQDIFPEIEYDSFTLMKGSNTLTAVNGNFTQSCREGMILTFIHNDPVNTHHIKIEQVVDDNTLILEMPSLNEDFENINYFSIRLCVQNFIKNIILDGLNINTIDGQLISFSYKTILSQVIINNCVFKERAPIYDGIGYGWIISNSGFLDLAEIYPPFGSIIFNCYGEGVYINYTPYVTYLGCIISSNTQPNELSRYCAYIGCKFKQIRDKNINYGTCALIGCIFGDGEIFTNLPSQISVDSIKFPDGELSSTSNGLIYKDNDYTPLIYNIGQDKYTWNINGDVFIGNNIDGFRKVTFTGNLIKLNVIGEFGIEGTVTFDIINEDVVIFTKTITVNNYSENINLLVAEDSLLSINITAVSNVSNITIELIERS